MRTRTIILFAFILLAARSALSAEWRTDEGQPFCTERDQLQEFLLAGIQKDREWIKQLKSCMAVKAGLKMAVIEEDEETGVFHVAKVRLFLGNTSAVGYTIRMETNGSPTKR